MYKTIVKENYCNCKAWKYQRKPNRNRDCKHLIKKRGFTLLHSEDYEYVKSKPSFMLLSETVPTKPIINVDDYVFSRKFDGIRVALNSNGDLITRSGVVLKDYIQYKPPFQLDGELCHLKKEGYVNVMKALDKKEYSDLVVRVFDFFPDEEDKCIPYIQRYDELFNISREWPKKKMEFVVQHNFEIDGSFLQDQIKKLVLDCRDQGFEGIVVRSKKSCYIRSGTRDNKVIFKIKP
jgi:ATP-dependent DNA ligase